MKNNIQFTVPPFMGFASIVVPKSQSKRFNASLLNLYSKNLSIHTCNKRQLSTSPVNHLRDGNDIDNS